MFKMFKIAAFVAAIPVVQTLNADPGDLITAVDLPVAGLSVSVANNCDGGFLSTFAAPSGARDEGLECDAVALGIMEDLQAFNESAERQL